MAVSTILEPYSMNPEIFYYKFIDISKQNTVYTEFLEILVSESLHPFYHLLYKFASSVALCVTTEAQEWLPHGVSSGSTYRRTHLVFHLFFLWPEMRSESRQSHEKHSHDITTSNVDLHLRVI